MKDYLKYTLMVLLHPSCWIRNYGTCMQWDAYLNDLIDYYEPKHDEYESEEIAVFGDTEVWIANKFYAYGTKWDIPLSSHSKKLPSRKTVMRLYDVVRKAGLA